MVGWTTVAVLCGVSFLAGGLATWSLNAKLTRMQMAIERARHHWDASMNWLHELMKTARQLAVLAGGLAVVLAAGGVFGWLWLTGQL